MSQNTKTQANSNKFDFDEYNKIMADAGAGLKIYLAQQMMEDVETACRKYKNPLTKDVTDISDEITSLRAAWKANAEKREQISQVAADVDAKANGTHQEFGDVPLATA